MKKLAKSVAHSIFDFFQEITGNNSGEQQVILVAPGVNKEEIAEVKRRSEFFLGVAAWDSIKIAEHLTIADYRRGNTILYLNNPVPSRWLVRMHGGAFDIDWRRNPSDGWNWIDAATHWAGHKPDIAEARQRYHVIREELIAKGKKKVYVFGTGPSLSKAIDRDWSDGLRIVCNTIVRDKELWDHIDPDLIVAGDGIYHFGFTAFAKAFRTDLEERLRESPKTNFIYPAQFDFIVRRDIPIELHRQLVPIPVGIDTGIHSSMQNFELPALGNVLNLLLLPIACDLGRQVGLWGFDGRAPKDALFWSNSSRHTYSEFMLSLQEAHPAFFDHHVPKTDPEKYLREVHGDVLDNRLTAAEALGWEFEMLHRTWTESLAKRITPQFR